MGADRGIARREARFSQKRNCSRELVQRRRASSGAAQPRRCEEMRPVRRDVTSPICASNVLVRHFKDAEWAYPATGIVTRQWSPRYARDDRRECIFASFPIFNATSEIL